MKLEPLKEEEIPLKTKEIFEFVRDEFGLIPKTYTSMGYSPVALKAYLDFDHAIQEGEFTPKEDQAIKLAVSEVNQCYYSLSKHTAIAKAHGFSEEDTIRLRSADHSDPRLRAITRLARDIVISRGNPSSDNIDAFFDAGYSKTALVEMLGIIAIKNMSNYLNKMFETPIDFPLVKKLAINETAVTAKHSLNGSK